MLTMLLTDSHCHSHFTGEKNLADKDKIKLDQGQVANRRQSWGLNFRDSEAWAHIHCAVRLLIKHGNCKRAYVLSEL